MKKIAWMLVFCLALIPLQGQKQEKDQPSFIPQSLVINIEVPVRVFKDGRFEDALTIKDFEVLENGELQKIEAVYLIKKNAVTRSEEKERYLPQTQRSYYLFFQISDYDSRLEEGFRYFLENIISAGDSLYVISPLKTYKLRDRALDVKSNEDIVKEVRDLLRKDCLIGSADYRNASRDLINISRAMAARMKADAEGASSPGEGADPYGMGYDMGVAALGSEGSGGIEFMRQDLDEILLLYEGLLSKINLLRKIDNLNVMDFARHLKMTDGQKYVFLFYQREVMPTIDPAIINRYLASYQDNPYIQQTLSSIHNFERRDIPFDIDLVKQSYADSSAAIHFLFLTKQMQLVPGVSFTESSDDIYSAFRQMALATGGYFESTANPAAGFRNALDAAENYYLIYYTPKEYVSDGQFRTITVQLKNRDLQNLKLVHRAGYIRN
ncbi:MAG: hypothetical protein KKB53_10780 [Acidobacteria bacterium]|nr:hypothetical protein [Acidobacteriota bacterium]MCG2815379.1 hypothetical protein [Candidatus Aminicenantes bacterium]